MLVDACECLPVTPREEGSGLIYFDLATLPACTLPMLDDGICIFQKLRLS